MKKHNIGELMFYPIGTNPYHRNVMNNYRLGNQRAVALADFQRDGTIPKGYAIWSDSDKVDVTDPGDVNW